jgi:prophage DNA circulation protein
VADGAGSPYAEARELAAQQLRVESVTVLAETAADLLAQEALTPALSPADLEAIAADIRARAQACIDWYRAHLEMEQAHEAAEALTELAWSVQDLAASVIQLRPPIIERAAEGPACLRLIAHQWYGDHARAAELLRLNPRLQLPNFIERGQTLNAYAE